MTVTRCAADWRCRDYDIRTRLPAWADHVLCAACLTAAERDVRALVLDYVDLEQAMAGTKRSAEPVSGTRERAPLICLQVETMQRAIWLTTTTWEEVIRDLVGLPAPAGPVRDGFAVQRAVGILLPRIELLAEVGPTAVMPHGPDGEAAEVTGAAGIISMTALHAAARAALGLTRLTHEMPGECSACGLSTLRRDDQSEAWALRRENGSETVYCAACGASWSWDEYRRYVELSVAHAKAQR